MSIAASWWVGLFAMLLLLLVGYIRSGRPGKCLAFTACSGVGALGLLWLAGIVFPLPMTVTPFTILCSGILGLPGVLWMLAFPLL